MNPPVLPPQPPSPQIMEDASHLRMLSIAYYVYAGLTACFSILGIIYTGFGGAILMGKIPMGPRGATPPAGGAPPTEFIGGFIFGFGVVMLLIITAMTIMAFLTARWISARKHPTFCLVMAGLCCLNMPLGTVLGVFTFIVLLRPSIQQLFLQGPEQNNFVRY